jgi:hypothetical protein
VLLEKEAVEGGRQPALPALPEDQSDQVTLSHEELSLLLGGINLTRTRRKKWYRETILESKKI